MAYEERIDPLEKLILKLVGVSQETQGLAARILEEGAYPSDLLAPPGRGIVVATTILIRALRPPFRLSDNTLLGEAEYWET